MGMVELSKEIDEKIAAGLALPGFGVTGAFEKTPEGWIRRPDLDVTDKDDRKHKIPSSKKRKLFEPEWPRDELWSKATRDPYTSLTGQTITLDRARIPETYKGEKVLEWNVINMSTSLRDPHGVRNEEVTFRTARWQVQGILSSIPGRPYTLTILEERWRP